MSDFIQFEEKLLAHYFQGTDFSSILLRCKIDLSIATLTNLSKDLEVTMMESCAALPKIGSFSAQILVSCSVVLFCRDGWRSRKLGVEERFTALAVVHVAQEVKVVVQEIYRR